MAPNFDINRKALTDRFFRYISIDTQSDPRNRECPSTPGQLDLAHLLAEELKEMGVKNVSVDDHAYVMGILPSNTTSKVPVIGFIAHLDTSPDMTGKGVRPQIHENYDGGELILNASKQAVMDAKDFPVLRKYKGHTLITSDGTTLLGADNKAGIAGIMTALDVLQMHPEITHGEIRVCFTPDEEIGRGADLFNTKRFGADFAYTIDGGELGELQYENFNAAWAGVSIQGINIHPGEAKDKMINASLVGMELNGMLPESERPEHTDGYEGFYHLTDFSGNVEAANMEYIIRDHSHQRFEQRKSHIRHCVNRLKEKYGSKRITLEIKDQYYNMHSKIHPVMHVVELAKTAIEAVGVKPLIRPVRGGTDGARLSYMGLPCPNIFAGGHNYHGRYEFISLESMEKATETIVHIARLAAASETHNASFHDTGSK